MRDVFEDLFANAPLDPVEAVRRATRPQWRRRFYQAADVAEAGSGFELRLDGRSVRTPARRILAAPSRALADTIAAEWQAQRDVIDPAQMPLTRLANAIIDGVAQARAAVKADVANYLACDLLLYRATAPERLVELQALHWDPVLAWASEALGARFALAEGVVPVAQPEQALAAARTAIADEPWRLGAMHAITTLTGSALIALALAAGRLSTEAAWAAAHVDEDWNIAQWGRDEIALERRALRFAEMQAAAAVLKLC
jgi:chaperone required for assembly of F1-ATPase